MTLLIFYIAALLFSATAMVMSLKRHLMMLQQNSYRNDRFRRWLKSSGDSTSFPRLFAMIFFLASLIPDITSPVSAILVSLAGLIGFIPLVGKKYKKPLVFTSRAQRIYGVSLLLCLIAAAAFCILPNIGNISVSEGDIMVVAEVFIICYIISSRIIEAANFILEPVQASINRRYYNDAARILQSMPGLTVVGITGSYGKTSTKHYLHRILSEKYETVMTPGSFNTTLGVVRTIRDSLKPYTEVFIAEMGAKQKGDIKEICDLVHPSVGIVTAVGPQHLESFGSIENVQATKFELIDALPSDGFAVVNNDFEYVSNRRVTNVATVRYGLKNRDGVAATATVVATSAAGTDFVISYEGQEHQLHTRLVGECNVSNLLAAVVTALHLGVEPRLIARAVESIEQVEHRLNIKRTASGIIIIDDAFNSNPSGSRMALDVLGAMTSGRRIVITPGMIELGEQQYDLNRAFGAHMAKTADVAIVVGEYNRDAITEGLKSVADSAVDIRHAADFSAAQTYMQTIARPGDIVLYENDLPDTFK